MKEKVLEYLKSDISLGKTPTEIGVALGKSYNQASSSVNLPLKKLIDEGLVKRVKINGNILYRFIDNCA